MPYKFDPTHVLSYLVASQGRYRATSTTVDLPPNYMSIFVLEIGVYYLM